ncbi:MAG: 2Fe-2S iron-sulfur cluster binding domain-containing protein [Acidobacteria bacterium]|nr:2Fe-2S iron-sulfur cluster binding domain-containing protein [Acidobacteriota bacterium]
METRVNGTSVHAEVESRTLLTDFLRQDLRLTGTNVGCEHGVCGACTVLFDGEPVRACLIFAVQANGHTIETVESLANSEEELHPLQEAFREAHALQCGFCTPGILMSLAPDLDEIAALDEDAIRERLSGNLCRCTGYQHIVDAIQSMNPEADGD